MPIKYNPQKGQILMCDFTKGFEVPEIVKERPVIVFKSSSRAKLVTIVPLSTVAPPEVHNFHMIVPNKELPNSAWFKNNESWLKGDMIYTVGWQRLSPVKMPRKNGKRAYYTGRISFDMLKNLEKCVLHGIGLGRLEKHL